MRSNLDQTEDNAGEWHRFPDTEDPAAWEQVPISTLPLGLERASQGNLFFCAKYLCTTAQCIFAAMLEFQTNSRTSLSHRTQQQQLYQVDLDTSVRFAKVII